MSPFARWTFEPGVLACALVALGLYGTGIVRFARLRAKRWPLGRTGAWLAGVLVALLTLLSPLDALGDRAFAPHMVQHLLLTDVVAPLLLFGGPLPLLLGAVRPRAGRRTVAILRSPFVRAATSPPVAWLQFVGLLWAIHYSPLYDAALENNALHAWEHALFLGSALLFWLPVVPLGAPIETARGLAYPMRMLYVFLAMPAEGLLGFTIYTAQRVMYPHYAAATNPFGLTAAEDQRYAGEWMWLGAMLLMFVALVFCVRAWAREEEAEGVRLNRALDRAGK